MGRFKKILIRLLRTKRFTKKGIRVFKPCMYGVHPTAIVEVKQYLNYNKQWDDQRTIGNRTSGSLFVEKK